MKKSAIVVLVWLAVPICVGDGTAAEGYQILFKDVTSKLALEEKQQILEQLKFRVGEDGKFFAENCDRDLSPVVEITDLNEDGVEEVFVHWGNLCTSGNAGRSVSLFIKGPEGHYVKNLEFPSSTYQILATKHQGFPDLEFAGPGFCHGVWRWNGSKYDYACSREEKPGGCLRRGVTRSCE